MVEEDCGPNVEQLNCQDRQPCVQDDARDFNQHGYKGRLPVHPVDVVSGEPLLNRA